MEQQTKAMDFEVVEREFVSGFALSGEYVKKLDNKSFEIVGQKTVLMPSIDNPLEKKEKLILSVKLADGTIIDYFPNKTSQKVIINMRGFKLDAWIGFAGRFITESQKVGATKRDVIYIEELGAI